MASKNDPERLLADTPYIGVEVIGQGGMGLVIEAVHRTLGQTVAVKLLRVELGADPGLVDRLHLEGKVQARLLSPHLARVIDAGATKRGDAYIVMERLVGRSLGEELKLKGALPAARAARYVHEALQGLSVAHAAGVVHRDVKPQNLFLSDEDNPGHPGEPVCKVLDFGVAKFLDVGAGGADGNVIGAPVLPTAPGMVVGSPRYMSPEQAQATAVDPRSDIYSMGCVLYHALSGRDPFHDRKGLFEFCQAHVYEVPPSPSEVLGRPVDPRLEAIVEKAMAKDPARRYQSAALFADDLGRVMRSPAPRAAATPSAESARPPSTIQGTDQIDTGEGTRFATSDDRGVPAPATPRTLEAKRGPSSRRPAEEPPEVATTPMNAATEAEPAPHVPPPAAMLVTEDASSHGSLDRRGRLFVLAFVVALILLGLAVLLTIRLMGTS